ncbi:MAG TPA: hypothetical protein PLP21_07850, partial [Pyrinomonadaceae bacterium]|nr:hypothetical protein [Pyrinomonadaceae bacterium]
MSKQKTHRINQGIASTFLLILFLCSSVFAAWETVGRVTKVTNSKANGVVLDTSSKAKVLVEFFGANVIRVRVAPSGKFEGDFSFAIDPAAKFADTKITV